MTRSALLVYIGAAMALCAVAVAHDGPVYNYPITAEDVTVHANIRSVICEADGSQTIEIRRKLTINSPRGAELFSAPSVSWRDGAATAWLLDVTVRRDDRPVFHLGPRPDGPELQLHPTDDGTGPMRRAEVPMPELQAGDWIEWAVQLRREPIIEGHVFAQMTWALPFSSEHGRFSVTVPREMQLQARSWGESVPEPLVVPEGDHVTWSWRVAETVEPVPPSRNAVIPQTIVSSAPSWAVVGRWFRQKLTAEGDELGEGAGPALVASVAGMMHADRIDGVFAHVRDSLALPHGAPWNDPFIARAPAKTLATGIGDCKDRARLIFRALQEAGLTPHLALTGVAAGLPPLAEQPPTPLLLDHVLVGVSGPGRIVWLDPTGAAEQEVDCGRTLQALVLDETRQPVVTVDRLRRHTSAPGGNS